jgi:ion channel POLLUX/CASTOR
MRYEAFMQKPTFRDHLRYRFDNFMSRGVIALVGALLAVTLLIILAATLIMVLARLRPDGSAGPFSFAEAAWQVTMRSIDTGTVAGDTGWPARLVGFAVTLGGIFIASALIGILATGLEGRLSELRRGRSRVIEAGHSVILGWSPQVFSIISELAIANRQARDARPPSATSAERARRSACVAILADKDKVEMEEEIRTKAPDALGTRVVCRSGNPLDLDDLRLVSPETARAIVVLSPGGPYPDVPVGKTLLALVKAREAGHTAGHIVAAFHKPANLPLARMIAGDQARVFAVDGLISRLIAQTCRQAGLSVVYAELFSFEGAAVRFFPEDRLAGTTYGDALFRYPAASLIGLQHPDGQVQVNPPMDTPIEQGARLIAIATGYAAIHQPMPAGEPVDASAICTNASAQAPLERLLILGWNRRGPIILDQLSYYMPPGSDLHIVAPLDPQQMRDDCSSVGASPLQVTFERANPIDRPTLEKLAAGGYQYIIILSPGDIPDIQIADAATMISLLHLRDIARRSGTVFSIVSEILDVRNRDLAEVTSADDVIISERLVALALAQVAENQAVMPVFQEFLSPGGPEIYLKPAQDYVMPGRPVNFYTVVEAARRKGQTAIGYRLLAEASDPDVAFGVHLNPDKPAPITFCPDDRIIVLAVE